MALPPGFTCVFIVSSESSIPLFYSQNNAYFIVDEVQTGGGSTGHMWYHEAWNLPEPPDVVVFSKKTLTGGFYFQDELMPREVTLPHFLLSQLMHLYLYLANSPFQLLGKIVSCISFQAGRVFNTWMGDPSKVLLLEAMVNVVREHNLLENVRTVGKHLHAQMMDLQVQSQKLVLHQIMLS